MGAVRYLYRFEKGSRGWILERVGRSADYCPVCMRPEDGLVRCTGCAWTVCNNRDDDEGQPDNICATCWRESRWGP